MKKDKLYKTVKYKCKQNDAEIKVITFENKIDELHLRIEGDKGWIVIGYKDLQEAINMAENKIIL